MAEIEPQSDFVPLFSSSVLQENPGLARIMLKEYWKQQATLTRRHLEEMGLEGSSLEFFGSHIGEIIFDDSAKAEDVVGTGNYRNEEIDHFVERVVFMITEDVEESFRNRSISLTNRYFQERRRQHIFTYTKTEHIPEACMVNGGIPGWTKKEDIFLKEF